MRAFSQSHAGRNLAAAGSLALCVTGLASERAHAELRLAWPVACTVGETCFVQHYVDHGSAGVAKDYRCGTVTYAGHNGTDIRILTMDDERRGVDVLAAAAGRVLRVRDNMDDVSAAVVGRGSVRDRECGNGLVVSHANGYETQYCHMAKGSIVVQTGDPVTTGQRLGHVGLSGDTEFPHLHITVRHNGAVVDPFAIGEPAGACEGGTSLWEADTARRSAYRAAAVLNAGFATHPVTMEDIENGVPQVALTSAAPALVAFFRSITLKQGDVQTIALSGPIGSLKHSAPALSSNKDQVFLLFGRKRPPAGWPEGTYTARFQVARDGQIVAERTISTKIGNDRSAP